MFEIGRVGKRGITVIQDLVNRIGSKIDDHPFEAVVVQAIKQTLTPDPFDRLIVGQASIRSTTIVTKDVSIHQHYKNAIW